MATDTNGLPDDHEFGDDDFEIEVEEGHAPPPTPVAEADDDDSEPTEEELEGYSARVQKRFGRLTKRYHDERRAREAAEGVATEATSYAQRVMQQRADAIALAKAMNERLGSEAKARAELAVSAARRALSEAHTAGDPDAIAQATEQISQAQADVVAAANISKSVADDWRNSRSAPPKEETSRPAPTPQRQAPPEPDARARKWADDNDWFGQDEEMTSFAYGVHEKLLKSGVDASSEDYYKKLDARMRAVFPAEFSDSGEGDVEVEIGEPRKLATSKVAPASRRRASGRKKIVLTQSQVDLAKRMGLTPKQYAAELALTQEN